MRPPPRWNPPSAEAVERIRQLAERQLSVEEFDAYVHAPMSEAERQEILESVAWFTKRYPTPGERLAAAPRPYKQWARGMPDRDQRPNEEETAHKPRSTSGCLARGADGDLTGRVTARKMRRNPISTPIPLSAAPPRLRRMTPISHSGRL